MRFEREVRKLEQELSKLSRAKFRPRRIKPVKLLSCVDRDIVRAARYFSKMCRDRERCFRILVELMRRYRPDDVLSWVQEQILSEKSLDVELEKVLDREVARRLVEAEQKTSPYKSLYNLLKRFLNLVR